MVLARLSLQNRTGFYGMQSVAPVINGTLGTAVGKTATHSLSIPVFLPDCKRFSGKIFGELLCVRWIDSGGVE